jgi:DNA-directed RNA polymerase specialized sigma24 family protein
MLLKCVFFGGMSEREIAEVLNVNERTIKRDWEWARTWLASKMRHSEKTEK